MQYYFAQFLPDEEQPDVYNVSFPDLPGCVTFGTGLDEAMTQAMDALTAYLEVEMARGEKIPEASDMETARAKAEAEDKQLDIPPHPGTLYLLVPADPAPEPFIRLNISMQPRLVAKIDRYAKECGMTRSGLLAAAAREYINRPASV